MTSHRLRVAGGGVVRCVYDDALHTALAGVGTSTITRASHVEPHPIRGGWIADMRPVAGTDIILGANGSWFLEAAGWALIEPFLTREAALNAERRWLAEHLGL